MLKKQYLDYIRRELLELSVQRYPNDPHRQMLYQIGFLQAQLADIMHRDSTHAHRFNQQIRQAK